MNTFLLEIGTEEIPAGYIQPALDALAGNLSRRLTAARISHAAIHTLGTPRRLAVMVEELADRQESVVNELVGPPESVAYDAAGNPQVAAQKFAEKAGIPVAQLAVKETPKGRYLCAEVKEEGRDTAIILPEILPELILATPFPKTMKWGEQTIYFARPIHWILALLGADPVEFSLGDIRSGNISYGHRFMHPQAIKIREPREYLEKLRQAYVYADPDERREMIQTQIRQVAQAQGGNILPDNELIDIVNNLVEYPASIAGKFEDEFLELPDEVLITAMREHQKYFAVIDDQDNLLPCFVVVNNTQARDMNLVATGHERVIRARLSDAKFFYQSDINASFDDWVEKLKGVLFQAKLGSMYEKVMRVRDLTEFIAESVDQSLNLKKQVSRAAYLCKADLVSQVVVEFTKLQGVMGRVYADKAGEPGAVAVAIEEHYRPTYSGGPLPETTTGAILAIADKMDSICGCFSVDLIPTGASDPYALRRQGIGVLQIMAEKGFTFSLMMLIERSLTLFGTKSVGQIKEIAEAVYRFLQNRMAHLLAEQGYSKDVIAAVTAVSVDNVPQVWQRVEALEKLKAEPDFEPLAVAFKRVVNIIRKDGGADADESVQVNPELFEDACESELFEKYRKAEKEVLKALDEGDFEAALLEIASLKPQVDGFFDGVMVMTDQDAVRKNRLALLKAISDLFAEFADFSRLSA